MAMDLSKNLLSAPMPSRRIVIMSLAHPCVTTVAIVLGLNPSFRRLRSSMRKVELARDASHGARTRGIEQWLILSG